MSNAVVLLDAYLREKESEYGATPLPADEVFEIFSFEQALKGQDLSLDEVVAGQVGGGNDGGIDGVFTFLNGNLVDEDAEVLEDDFQPQSVQRRPDLKLVLIQAKRTGSFAETPVDKLMATLREVLDLTRTVEDLTRLFSQPLVARIEVFRQTWQKLATRHPAIRVSVVYATKGDTAEINNKVRTRADRLRDLICELIPNATPDVVFLGARELVDLARREKSYTLQLKFVENATADDSHVALVTLDDYFAFISDEAGALRKYIFDWNVRDYEGDVEVNREIEASLAAPDAPEFWWLNNGVTIVCSHATAQFKTFVLDDVQIVNGLQTSVTVYRYLSGATPDDPARRRSILVRVIVTNDYRTRDQVIRATNRQTHVPVASLRATDEIQRDLEQYFLSRDWFYERRKNYYRNQGKATSRIVTIPFLAQAVMAIGLSEPSNSRARPSSLLKRDADYHRIFDEQVDYGTYLWAAQVQKAVDHFLRTSEASASAAERTNLRFHVSMLLVARAHGKPVRKASEIAGMKGREFSTGEMSAALADVRGALAEYQEGRKESMEKIVKGREFTEYLLRKVIP